MAKIMVTDDSVFMKDMIRDIVAEVGCTVEHATSGEELIANYMNVKPDVVVLDIVMSGMDGFDTLDKLMKIDPKAKVVICSALAGEDIMANTAIKKGAYACLRKPFSATQLIEVIEQGLQM